MLPVVTDQAFINAAMVSIQGQKYVEFAEIIARNKGYFTALTKLIQLDFDEENFDKVSEFLCSAMVLLNEQCKLDAKDKADQEKSGDTSYSIPKECSQEFDDLVKKLRPSNN